MAVRIPTFAELPQVTPRAAGGAPSYLNNDPGAVATAGVGAGLQRVGAAAANIEADERHKKNLLQSTQATSQLEVERADLLRRIDQETDAGKIAELKSEPRKRLEANASLIADPAVREIWIAKHSEAAGKTEVYADKRAWTLQRDAGLASSYSRLEALHRDAAQADEADGATKMRAGHDEINALETAGFISREEAAKRHRSFSDGYITGRAKWLDANDQPQAALDFVRRNAAAIPPEKLDALVDSLRARVDRAVVKGVVQGELGSADKGYTGPRGAPRPGDPRGMEPVIRSLAQKYGHDPDIAMKVARSEGLGAFYGDGGKSGTAFQLYTGGGLGNEFQKETGLDPLDPKNEVAAIDWALKNLDRTGWSPYHGAKKVGIGPRDGIGTGAPRPTEDELDKAPAVGAPIPLDGLPPHRDIDAIRARVQARADRGEITQDQANAASAEIRTHHNNELATQANVRTALKHRLANGIAALTDGRDFTYSPDEVRHFFPKEQADEILLQLDDAKEAGLLIAGMRNSPPDDIARQRSRIEAGLSDPNAADYAKRRRQLDLFDKSYQAHREALIGPKADPAGYLAQHSPLVQEKRAALDPKTPQTYADYATAVLSEQERLGLRPEDRRILSNAEAAALVAKVANTDPAQADMAAVLDGYAGLYGDAWPRAFGDLVRNGLPASAQTLATMTQPDQAAARTDFQRTLQIMAQKGGAAKLKDAAGAEAKAIETNLDSTLEDFRLTTRSPVLYETVKESVRNLAMYYAYGGKSGAAALEAAYDGIIGRKYDINGSIRAPKGTLGTVEKAAETLLSRVTLESVQDPGGGEDLSPEHRKRAELDAIQRGRWEVNKSDTGLIRMALRRDGSVVPAIVNGRPLEFSFAAAPELAKGAPPLREGPAIPRPAAPRPGSTVLH